MFLDIVSVILITTPILLPIIVTAGYDPIWFGVVMIIACEMAVITPPVGLNLYVIKGIAPHITLGQIINGVLPFVLRSEEHTSELQSLLRISYAVFCLTNTHLLAHETSQYNTKQLKLEKQKN